MATAAAAIDLASIVGDAPPTRTPRFLAGVLAALLSVALTGAALTHAVALGEHCGGLPAHKAKTTSPSGMENNSSQS